MKTLFILRHAEAMPNSGSSDLERDLTAKGLEQAKRLGEAMLEKKYLPALALCSTANRTRQTLEGILESVKIPAVQHDKAIYHATVDDLLAYVQAINDKYESALIVGHNPTVHEFAAMMAGDDNAPLTKGYAPGTLSVLSCPRDRWKDLQGGENRLTDLVAASRL